MTIVGYAFVNEDMTVVQAIGGDLSPTQLAAFERDYRAIFGAEFSIPVGEDVTVYVGGKYDPETGTFTQPQPEAIIEEPTP